MALAKPMPRLDWTDQAFNYSNFSAPQEKARGFDGKASMLNCKGSSQLAAMNRTGSGIKSVFPVANEEFLGTPRLDPAMGMGYAFSRRHGSGVAGSCGQSSPHPLSFLISYEIWNPV